MRQRHLYLVTMDAEPVECECADCGLRFNRGDQGDNEQYCLRCEARDFIARGLDLDELVDTDEY